MTKITAPRPPNATRSIRAVLLGLAAWVAGAGGARAQEVDVDFAVEQLLTSYEGMPSPTGYRIGLAVPGLVGPVGLELGYRSVSEYLGEQPSHCGIDVCVPGPFESVIRMRAVTLGIGLSRALAADMALTFGGIVTLAWQDTRYGGVEGTASARTVISSDSAGSGPGTGAFVTWRLPPVLSVLRPLLYARAEWLSGGACDADAACFSARTLGSAGLGVGLRLP